MMIRKKIFKIAIIILTCQTNFLSLSVTDHQNIKLFQILQFIIKILSLSSIILKLFLKKK